MNARRKATAASSALLALGIFAGTGLAQQGGLAERLGQGLDGVGRGIKRGAVDLSDSVRRRFEVVSSDVQRMGTAQRVYARLHWDKSLNAARIEVHMLRGGVVLLRGSVADQAARERAVALASATMDVNEVIDELVPLAASIPSATTNAPVVKPSAAPTTVPSLTPTAEPELTPATPDGDARRPH